MWEKTKSRWIAGGVAAVLLVAVLLGVFLFLRSSRQIRVSDACFIEEGEIVNSEHTWKLSYDKKKGTTLKGDGRTKNLTDDGTVIYMKDEDKVLLPQAYGLQFAAGDKIYRLEYFSTLEKTEDGILIKDGGSSVTVSGGIAYDGVDNYLFLEPVTLKADGAVYELPVLSTAHVVFANRIDLYIYGEKAEKIPLYTDSEVTVSFSEGRTLMPLTDRVLLENQGWCLMSTAFRYLPRIDAWKE